MTREDCIEIAKWQIGPLRELRWSNVNEDGTLRVLNCSCSEKDMSFFDDYRSWQCWTDWR